MNEESKLPTDGASEEAKARDGDLVQTARDVGSATSERLHDLRDAAQPSD